jgi:hypothetical protein
MCTRLVVNAYKVRGESDFVLSNLRLWRIARALRIARCRRLLRFGQRLQDLRLLALRRRLSLRRTLRRTRCWRLLRFRQGFHQSRLGLRRLCSRLLIVAQSGRLLRFGQRLEQTVGVWLLAPTPVGKLRSGQRRWSNSLQRGLLSFGFDDGRVVTTLQLDRSTFSLPLLTDGFNQ